MTDDISGFPVLYSFRRCPYAMRARLALAMSGQKCVLREIVLRDKPDEMLALSPKGTVPVLVLPSGEVIGESLEIMQWALIQNDPEGWLAGTQAQRDDMLSLVSLNDSDFKYHLDRYKYPDRYGDGDGLLHREKAEDFLGVLDSRLAMSPWLAGDSASLADFAIAPFIRQFANTGREWFDAAPYSHLQGWLARFLESGLFASVMLKYKPWKQTGGLIWFPSV